MTCDRVEEESAQQKVMNNGSEDMNVFGQIVSFSSGVRCVMFKSSWFPNVNSIIPSGVEFIWYECLLSTGIPGLAILYRSFDI